MLCCVLRVEGFFFRAVGLLGVFAGGLKGVPAGFRDSGLEGFRGSGSRVQGLGFRV